MMKHILCMLALALAWTATPAEAQTSGYYRLQNAATEHVLNVAGHTHIAPNVGLEQALTLPGTVASTQIDGTVVSQLTVQNVDVVNMVIPTMKEMVVAMIDEQTFLALKDTLTYYVGMYMAANVADLVLPLVNKYTYDDFKNYVATADANIYLEDAGDGRQRIYVNTPKFPLNAGILNSYLTGVANDYLDLLRFRLRGFVDDYAKGREYLVPTAYTLANSLYFNDKLYLDEISDDTYGPLIGFSNTKQYEALGGMAMWRLLPVDDQNYLAVEGRVSDGGGVWYSSLTLGFPVTLAQGMKAYYLNDKVDAANSQVEWHEIEDNVIPAMTPMVLRLNGQEASLNRLTPTAPVAYEIDGNTLQCATDSLGLLLGFSISEPDPRHYVLGTVDGKVGMVETTQTYFEANTPYYLLSEERKAAETKGFLAFVTEVNGIRLLETAPTTPKVVYDLAGRRVSQPKAGIYVVDGKKIVVH